MHTHTHIHLSLLCALSVILCRGKFIENAAWGFQMSSVAKTHTLAYPQGKRELCQEAQFGISNPSDKLHSPAIFFKSCVTLARHDTGTLWGSLLRRARPPCDPASSEAPPEIFSESKSCYLLVPLTQSVKFPGWARALQWGGDLCIRMASMQHLLKGMTPTCPRAAWSVWDTSSRF